jgi:thiamine transport system permease protein
MPVLFLGLFLVYPLARILAMGLAPLLSTGWRGIRELASRTGLGGLLLGSAGQALASTASSLAVGLPAAYVFARFDFPCKGLLRTLITVPFVLPTVVVGSAFIALIGPQGFLESLVGGVAGGAPPSLGLLHSLPAVLMAHVFFNVSIVVRIVGGFWASLDPRTREAAQVLGAGRLASFFTVTLRLLLPAIAAAGVLVFTYCFTSFGTVLILGGPRLGTLETEIYRQAVYMFDLPAAAFLSLIQLIFTALLMYGFSRLQWTTRVTMSLSPPSRSTRRPRGFGEWTMVAFFGFGLAALLLLPMGILAAGSLATRGGIGLDYWTGLFKNVRNSIFWMPPLLSAGNSLVFSLAAVLMSLAVGVPASYLISRVGLRRSTQPRAAASGLLDLLFLLPLGTSAATLGFGFLISLDAPPLDLRSSALLIPIAHTLVALPLVTRALITPLRSLDPKLREAASMLGAGPFRVRWEVDLPILRRALLTAAAFALTVSLGEFAATSLLTRPDLSTIPIAIFGYLGMPGDLNRGEALAMSTILMIACALGLSSLEMRRKRRRGGY